MMPDLYTLPNRCVRNNLALLLLGISIALNFFGSKCHLKFHSTADDHGQSASAHSFRSTADDHDHSASAHNMGNVTSSYYSDPEATNCSRLLSDFRKNKIVVVQSNPLFKKSVVTLATAHVRNKTFYVSTHDESIDKVRAGIAKSGQYYEKFLSKIIAESFEEKRENGEESIFLDVGGNIGWFSLVAAAHGAARVYSFEPNLQNTIRFCESLSLNGWLGGSVIPISKGLGNVMEERILFKGTDNNPGAYSFAWRGGMGGAVGNLKITTLDSFAEAREWFKDRPSIGFFKLDVEGFELQVLEGARRLLKSGFVEAMEMEFKPNQPKSTKSKIIQILFDAGYRPTKHGGWMGPSRDIHENFTTWQEILTNLTSYGENLMFQLEGR